MAVVATGVVLVRPELGSSRVGDPYPQVGASRLPTALPTTDPPSTALPAADEPGASADPARVGTDPNFLHFDASAITSVARHYTWTSGDGYEQLEAGIGDPQLIYAEIGPDLAVLDALQRQGQGHGDGGVVIREQPVPGLWPRVRANDEQRARQVVDAIELDRAQRIILPFQLSTLPADTRPVLGYVGFIDGHFVHGGVILRDGQDATMEAQAQHDRGWSGDSTRANHTIAGRPAFRYPGRDEVALLDAPHLDLSVRIGKAYAGFDVADADIVLGGVRVATDLKRMTTWPQSLVR